MSETNLDHFHKIFMELLNDLSIIRPSDTTLLFVKTASNLLPTYMLAEQFMSYIDPYIEKILSRDESFFINELHREVSNNSFASREVSKVREIWCDKETTDETKNCIWDYFNILTNLGLAIRKESAA